MGRMGGSIDRSRYRTSVHPLPGLQVGAQGQRWGLSSTPRAQGQRHRPGQALRARRSGQMDLNHVPEHGPYKGALQLHTRSPRSAYSTGDPSSEHCSHWKEHKALVPPPERTQEAARSASHPMTSRHSVLLRQRLWWPAKETKEGHFFFFFLSRHSVLCLQRLCFCEVFLLSERRYCLLTLVLCQSFAFR